jgi:uncharacterized protein
MPISMYQASIPIFIHMLGNLRNILQKGAAHATNKNFDATILVNSRLAPDMFALARQVQIATDMVKGCAARLAGVELPKYDDNETTIDELIARIDKTVAFLKEFSPAQIDGTEEKAIELALRTRTLNFDGKTYLQHFVVPNMYFHITTTYNILRHNGVELGKIDYIGG